MRVAATESDGSGLPGPDVAVIAFLHVSEQAEPPLSLIVTHASPDWLHPIRRTSLGDALAPVRPHTARGANNGIDQAAALVSALAQHRDDGVDLDVALSTWQERCLPMVIESLDRGPELGRALGLGLEV
jgi:2-polyprenyl-6-methoxyphenol hydroxylase-like FAD-dependent oxidoreductase